MWSINQVNPSSRFVVLKQHQALLSLIFICISKIEIIENIFRATIIWQILNIIPSMSKIKSLWQTRNYQFGILHKIKILCVSDPQKNLFQQHPSPLRKIFHILLEQLSISRTIKQSWQLVVYRVIIDICPIHKRNSFGSINQRFVISRNNLRDRHFMSTIQIALGNAGNVDSWIRCTNIKQSNKESSLFGFAKELQFLSR